MAIWHVSMMTCTGIKLSLYCKSQRSFKFKPWISPFLFTLNRPHEMFPSVSPYMSEDDLVNHLKSQLLLIAKQRGLCKSVSSVCIRGI